MVFNDSFEPTLWPLCHLKPLFALRTGIFSDLGRALKKKKPESLQVVDGGSGRPARFYSDYFQAISINADISFVQGDTRLIKPVDLIENIGRNIADDLDLLDHQLFNQQPPCQFKGGKDTIFIHQQASVSPAAFIDSSGGPVVIDTGVEVSAFSLLKGPLYIGPGCSIDRANIENSIIGRTCRLGGEIADSIFGDFSNKHHEGFVGHSLVGDWVNLGALTTTSDLKNNYGMVSLDYEDILYPAQTIKFGSIIGDFCKTAIGTMLNTGMIIDLGCLLFEGYSKRKYLAPFFWGGPGELYRFDRFIQDAEKVMARRQQNLTEFQKLQLQQVYSRYLKA